jgi:hypothetical protein
VRVFPGAGGEAALVRPGQPLDRDYVLDSVVAAGAEATEGVAGNGPRAAGPGAAAGAGSGAGWPLGKLSIFALFADHPFPLDHAPGPDIEVVPVRVDVEP